MNYINLIALIFTINTCFLFSHHSSKVLQAAVWHLEVCVNLAVALVAAVVRYNFGEWVVEPHKACSSAWSG